MAKILLIEDDQELLKTYEDILKKENHSIVVAADGTDGLNKFNNGTFDLLITDLSMPKLTGQKIIEHLQVQKHGDLPCPVIICSGKIDPKVIHSFANHEKIHFLPKPVSHKEFLSKTTSLLAKNPTQQKVDVRFINPILTATMSVIKQMTNFEITSSKPSTKIAGEVSGDISGIVGLVSSGFKGNISLSFSQEGFLKVVAAMLGEAQAEINDENKDAVAELLNIIFGQAKKALNETGLNIQPAIPIIILGRNHSVQHHSKHAAIVIPFRSKETGYFRVEISVLGG